MNPAVHHTNAMLIERLTEGDESAFMAIYERYWQKVFTIAYQRLHNIQEAEDIVHDVFTSLWANREQSQILLLENYLATATKYLVLGRLRKAGHAQDYLNTLRSVPTEQTPSLEESVHYKRILQLVQEEVQKLPEKCRMVFQYSRSEGMSVKQIAEVMHISPKTVEGQLTKALKQLRLALRSFLTSVLGLPLFLLFF